MASEIAIDPCGGVHIVTERLVLREMEEGDIELLSSFLPELDRRGYILPGQGKPEAIENFVLGSIAVATKQPRTYCALALVPKGSSRLIGTCGFKIHPDRSYACLGWDLEIGHWGQGLMPEAASAMLDLAFDHFNVRCVISDTFMFNRSSWRVMEKIGMARQRLSVWDEFRLARHYHVRRRIVRYYIYHNWFRGVVTDSGADITDTA